MPINNNGKIVKQVYIVEYKLYVWILSEPPTSFNCHEELIMVWNLPISVYILRQKVMWEKSYDINILSMCICI